MDSKMSYSALLSYLMLEIYIVLSMKVKKKCEIIILYFNYRYTSKH